jgi:NAD(P) transhydrogenase subunit alpha
VLVTREQVEDMAPGSVIVDLASERGGNCELTKIGEQVVHHGVKIIGTINLASTVPYHASQMYSRNLTNFLLHMVKDGQLVLNLSDEITRSTVVTRDGEIVNPRVREFFNLPVPVTQ